MLPILLIVALLFVLLFVVRLSGARRRLLLARWPAVVLGLAAVLMASRGGIAPALGLGAFAVLAWMFWPSFNARLRRYDEAAASQTVDPGDAEARSILGVGPQAGENEIRRAYRAKMASAHPDRGGSNAEAARLTAARDRLLKKKR